MTTVPHQLLALGFEHLAEAHCQNPETMPRSTVHTAYYAMFHAARAVLLHTHGTVSTKHGAVLAVYERLVEHEPPAMRESAELLRTACNARLIGDYTGEVVTAEMATEATDAATRFLAICARRLDVESPPTGNP